MLDIRALPMSSRRPAHHMARLACGVLEWRAVPARARIVQPPGCGLSSTTMAVHGPFSKPCLPLPPPQHGLSTPHQACWGGWGGPMALCAGVKEGQGSFIVVAPTPGLSASDFSDAGVPASPLLVTGTRYSTRDGDRRYLRGTNPLALCSTFSSRHGSTQNRTSDLSRWNAELSVTTTLGHQPI